MALIRGSRVRERTSTTGSGDIELNGLVQANERLFIDEIGDGNTTTYCLLSGDGLGIEEGIGTVHAGTPPTFSRDTVLRSTNSDAAISLVGESRIFGNFVPGDVADTAAPATQAGSGYTTWINQGTATVADTTKGFTITAPNVGAGTQVRALAKAKAAQPISYKALVGLNGAMGNYSWAGMGFYDGTKLISVELAFKDGTWKLHVVKWNTVSSFASVAAEIAAPCNPAWLRLREDSTDIYFEFSATGDDDDFMPVFHEAKGTWLGTITDVYLFAIGDNQIGKASFLQTETGT